MTDRDFITSTHRGHGHVIAKGGKTELMMAELYGKATGYCKGKGGSMHIADVDSASFGPTESSAPGSDSVGAASPCKYRKRTPFGLLLRIRRLHRGNFTNDEHGFFFQAAGRLRLRNNMYGISNYKHQ